MVCQVYGSFCWNGATIFHLIDLLSDNQWLEKYTKREHIESFYWFLEFFSVTWSSIPQVRSFLWKGLHCKALGCGDGETGQTICWSYPYAIEMSGQLRVSFQMAFFALCHLSINLHLYDIFMLLVMVENRKCCLMLQFDEKPLYWFL